MSERISVIEGEQLNILEKTMTLADAHKFGEWLGAGTETFRRKEAKFLVNELAEYQQDMNQGSDRALVMVMACLVNRTGNWQDADVRAKLMEQIYANLGGADQAQEIIQEGAGVSGEVWQIKDQPKTDLAEKVEEVVDEWVGTESLQAQLRTAKLKYQAREQALRNTNQRAEKAEAEGGNWNDERKKQLETLFASEPDKVRSQIAAAVKKLDPINDKKVASQIEAPENLAETDKTLLEKFGKLEGLDSGKLVAAGISNEGMGSLAQILRLQLEQRRAGQETTRQNNREKKAVRDYFAGHDLQLAYDQDNSGFGVENELSRQLEKAQSLGVNIFEADKELTVSTGQTEVTDLSLIFDPQGRLKTTKIKAATLSLEVFKDPRLLEEEMISVFGSERKQESESNAYIFARGENGFVVKYNNVIIGQVSFNQMAGEMIINWQTQNGDLAGYSVAKRLNQEWNQGIAGLIENKLGRLELKAVAKPGAEKPAETVAEVVASVEPAPVEEALPPAKVELPAPVVEEPAAVEEMPPPQP